MTQANQFFRFPQPVQPLNPARELRDGLTWFALVSKRAREILAARWLEEFYGDCMTLVPIETRQRSKGGSGGIRKVSAEYHVPLMPRIVFAGFASPPNWLAIWDGAAGLSNIVAAIGNQGTPSPMRVSEVERFRSSLEADRAAIGLPVLKEGGTATFVGEGPFNGHVVEIESLGPKFVEVAANWFGHVRVKVRREDLEALDISKPDSKLRGGLKSSVA